MKTFIVLALALAGCGGEPFTASQESLVHPAGDAAPEVGDEAAADDGGDTAPGQDASDGGAGHRDAGQDADAQGGDSEVADTGSTVDADAGDSVSQLADAGDAAPETSCTPLTHSDGLGQTYQDCTPLGTYDSTTAMEACAAWAGSGAAHPCIDYATGCGTAGAVKSGPDVNGQWAAWIYGSAPGQGHVYVNTVPNCPTSADPSWD